jgi:hypothetical protein
MCYKIHKNGTDEILKIFLDWRRTPNGGRKMPMIPDDEIERIKRETDLAAVIRSGPARGSRC